MVGPFRYLGGNPPGSGGLLMLTRLVGTKFQIDVLWNVASLVVLGATAVAVNAVIGRFAGPAALGLFNEVFAVFVILSQLCVGGVHFSVLSHLSRSHSDPVRRAVVATAAILAAAPLSAAVCLIAYLARPIAAAWFGDQAVATGLAFAIPGVFLFALNKVLLNILNGVGYMRAYAIFQALRFPLVLVGVAAVIARGLPSSDLPASLTFSESILFTGLMTYVSCRVIRFRLGPTVPGWVREHLSFGTRGFLSGMFAEMSTRVDIIMLGYFLNKARVGVYSLAAVIAEGINQVPFAVRKNVDPLLGRAFADGDTAPLESRLGTPSAPCT